jgi:hypothetical protein
MQRLCNLMITNSAAKTMAHSRWYEQSLFVERWLLTHRQCSMVCENMGRHVHVDFCRSDDPSTCAAAGLEHSTTRMQPEPDRPKDWISHKLYWQRTGRCIAANLA